MTTFSFLFSKFEKMSNESHLDVETRKETIKGVVSNSETYKHNVIKTARVRDEKHVNSKSKIVKISSCVNKMHMLSQKCAG